MGRGFGTSGGEEVGATKGISVGTVVEAVVTSTDEIG